MVERRVTGTSSAAVDVDRRRCRVGTICTHAHTVNVLLTQAIHSDGGILFQPHHFLKADGREKKKE